jgi:DNA-binding MarR family transcriptional regulator
MFDYLMATAPGRQHSLARRGLTANDARALWSLDASEGRPIGTLAREWSCDPANATFIIHRLSDAGLVQRRDGDDRRVKLVTLTAKGAATKRALLREYRTPPADFAALSARDCEALIAILGKLGNS